MGVGQIIYAVLLEFTEQIRNSYMYSLDCIRCAGFHWIGRGASYIPKEYDAMFASTHATDLFSFSSFYELSMAYKKRWIKKVHCLQPG